MNKKEYGFLVRYLLFLGNLCLHLLFKQVGEFGRYGEFEDKLSKLEKEYKKEIQ